MKKEDQTKLASGLIALVGLWVAISPIWIPIGGGALASVIITGLVIIAAGAVQYFTESAVPTWIMGIAAIWLFLSALIFGVSAAAAWSQILSAVATVGLAYWDGLELADINRHGRHGATTV